MNWTMERRPEGETTALVASMPLSDQRVVEVVEHDNSGEWLWFLIGLSGEPEGVREGFPDQLAAQYDAEKWARNRGLFVSAGR